MKRVLREIKKRGVDLTDLHALEVFGGSGESHVKDYASLVSSLELWEIDPKCEKPLNKRFPTATIRITDSYREAKCTSKKYNFIVIDTGMSTGWGHCEHFELFPNIFRVAMTCSILMLNVIPEIDRTILQDYPYLFNDTQLVQRGAFYKTDHPKKVNFDQMVDVYRDLSKANGFNLDWYFFQRRNFVYYLVLRITKALTMVFEPLGG